MKLCSSGHTEIAWADGGQCPMCTLMARFEEWLKEVAVIELERILAWIPVQLLVIDDKPRTENSTMKFRPSSILAMLGIISAQSHGAAISVAKIEPPSSPFQYVTRRGKRGGGNGGTGLIKKRHRTRPPDGYYTQQTPREHMHAAARLRYDIAHNLVSSTLH